MEGPNKFGRMLAKIRHLLFVLCVLALPISYYFMDNFKSVNSISSESLLPPLQVPVADSRLIKFVKNGFAYTLTPLYDYEIAGLVIHKQPYDTWYSIDRADKTFVEDFCIMWGDNLRNKVYQSNGLSVKQDFRFCIVSSSSSDFHSNEFSNSHIIVNDKTLEEKIKNIRAGDQVRITGKLSNVKGEALGRVSDYESSTFEWTTSTVRSDSGAGGCEVVFVTGVEIIKRQDDLFRQIFTASLLGIGLVLLSWIIEFLATFRREV